jgi:phosphotransferase system  glucose/maltose/N-acetylglucosamine-specific IIC component
MEEMEMNYTNEVTDVFDEEVNVIHMEPETNVSQGNGSMIAKAILIGLGVVTASVAVYMNKTKDKRKVKKISKAAEMLKKEGYNIEEPIVEEDDVVFVEETEVTESEE